MADATNQNQEQYNDDLDDSDFNSGFDDEAATSPAKTTGGQNEDPNAAQANAQDAKADRTETPEHSNAPKSKAKPEPAAPKYVQLTEEQFAKLNQAAEKTTAFEQQLSKIFGTVGNLKQVLDSRSVQTAQGVTIELPPDVVEEMESEFPEVAAHLKKSLEKALKGIKLAPGQGSQSVALSDDELDSRVMRRVMASETEVLEDAYPNWRDIVGTVDEEGRHDPNNAFRKWLATQPSDYQARINGTFSSGVIIRAIERFERAQAAATAAQGTAARQSAQADNAPQAAARRDRIAAAVQPKGDGGPPSQRKSVEDEFDEGFRSG